MRYYAAAEGRNFFVTRLVAEIAENYYGLMALDTRLENLESNHRASGAKPTRSPGPGSKQPAAPTWPVQRFLAEVRRNQSEKLIVNQDIIQAENRINFLARSYPQPVERMSGDFIDLNLHSLSVGVPAQLLQNRPDIRQAERELAATGLDVMVARKRFYPQGLINAGVGYQAFNPRYLFITPEALVANAAGNVLVPLINRKAIKADYFTANARQLQAVYNYQRVVLNAFIEVVNRLARVENYGQSIEIRKQQVQALEQAVAAATSLYQLPRAELPVDYLDVLTAQHELFAAIRDLIETKGEQLFAIVNTYQALGGGNYLFPIPVPKPLQPHPHSWKLWKHSRASEGASGAPVPPPPPPAGRDPGAASTPPSEKVAAPLHTAGGRGSGAVLNTGGGKGSGNASNTGGGEGSGAVPDTGGGKIPIPPPTPMGGEKGSGAASSTNDRPVTAP